MSNKENMLLGGIRREMRYKNSVSYNETKDLKWTPTAVDCYTLGCNCSKCLLHKLYFKKETLGCRMKEVVFELIRLYGAPRF